MMRNDAGKCCDNYRFERIQDLAHADGIEFTLGKCLSCGSCVVDCYAPYGPAGSSNVPVVISKAEADKITSIGDFKLLKKFMRDWFDAA